jgi:hypothetical protein
MLVRRKQETLAQLLTRLDLAIAHRQTREGQRRRTQMTDGFVVPEKPGNTGEP